MKFTKMQGLGNDYVYVDCFREKIDNPSEVAKMVSDRHFGIGSDGLILICPSDKAVACMDMYNMDGSQGEMCGNGLRCVAKYVYDNGYIDKKEFQLETLAGIKDVCIVKECNKKAQIIQIDMGIAKLDGKLEEDIVVDDKLLKMTAIDIGNPHAIYYLDKKEELYNLNLEKIGIYYENHSRFPDKVNSEFIYVEDRKNIYMRVWERGSGETLACGTGATASAYASILLDKCDDDVNVHLLGGILNIKYDRNSKHLYMSGEAKTVFTGGIDI